MKIYETTGRRIQELRKGRGLSEYALIYQTAVPPSTVKSILRGKSTNPGIVSIKEIAEGLNVTIRKLYNSKIFDDLGQED